MAKGRSGAGKLVRKPAKRFSTIAKIEKIPKIQLAEYFGQAPRSHPTTDQLPALRHFRPAYLRTLLSQLRLVGEGRSRLSL